MYQMFLNAALYCEATYGSFIEYGEDEDEILSFSCPVCGELLYFQDWSHPHETENWLVCPICGEEFADEN